MTTTKKDAEKLEVVVGNDAGVSTTGDNGHGHPKGDAGKAEDQKAEPKKAEPKPELPLAKESGLGAYKLTYHHPFVVLPDGERVECPHKAWGHEGDKAAKACLRALASKAGVRLPS